MRRGNLVLGLAIYLMAIGAAPAAASFHQIMVKEVFPGSIAHPNEDYVELQMYATGQTFVSGQSLTIYDDDGTMVGTATFPGNLTNGPISRRS